MKRRTALGALGGAIAAPTVWRNVNAQGLRRVKFTMSWLPEGAYAYPYITAAQGIWKKYGLDVEVTRGSGSLLSAQAVGTGAFDCGISSVDSILIMNAKNVELRGLALTDYNPTMGIAVLRDSAIRRPKDLEGKAVGMTAASSDAAFFPTFCKLNGVDIDRVRVVNIDAKVRTQTLIGGRVDAISGYASSMMPAISAAAPGGGRCLLYGDFGLPFYGNATLIVRPETAKDTSFVQALVDGYLEGLRFTLTQPDAAHDLFLKIIPELSLDPGAAQSTILGMAIQRWSVAWGGDARAHGLGWADLAKLDQMADVVMKYEAAPGAVKPRIDTIYTNRYSDAANVRLTPAEWNAIRSNTQNVADMIGKSTA